MKINFKLHLVTCECVTCLYRGCTKCGKRIKGKGNNLCTRQKELNRFNDVGAGITISTFNIKMSNRCRKLWNSINGKQRSISIDRIRMQKMHNTDAVICAVRTKAINYELQQPTKSDEQTIIILFLNFSIKFLAWNKSSWPRKRERKRRKLDESMRRVAKMIELPYITATKSFPLKNWIVHA